MRREVGCSGIRLAASPEESAGLINPCGGILPAAPSAQRLLIVELLESIFIRPLSSRTPWCQQRFTRQIFRYRQHFAKQKLCLINARGKGSPASVMISFLREAHGFSGSPLRKVYSMKCRKLNLRKRRFFGFSLLELLAVVTILGIIAVVVIPRISVSSGTAKQNADRQNRAEINSAVERWYFEKGVWPTDDLSDIAADAAYFPNGLPTNPVDASNYALNATTHRVN